VFNPSPTDSPLAVFIELTGGGMINIMCPPQTKFREGISEKLQKIALSSADEVS